MAPRWLSPSKWNAGTFALHPMCEWDGGHFLPSRHSYPLPDPQKNLRDMGSILHLQVLRDLAAIAVRTNVIPAGD